MKYNLCFLAVCFAFCMASCNTNKDIFINEDGSGELKTNTDLSTLFLLAKSMGGSNAESIMTGNAVHQDVPIATIVDSIEGINEEEKQLIKNGQMIVHLDPKAPEIFFETNFHFTKGADITQIEAVSAKLVENAARNQILKNDPTTQLPGDEMPQLDVDSYFQMTYSAGLISRKTNAETVTKLSGEKTKTVVDQFSMLGVESAISTTYHLPRKVKNVDGKNITISEDKMSVTVTSKFSDIVNDPLAGEFSIEY